MREITASSYTDEKDPIKRFVKVITQKREIARMRIFENERRWGFVPKCIGALTVHPQQAREFRVNVHRGR